MAFVEPTEAVAEGDGGVTGKELVYPALFTTAEAASKQAQRDFLRLVRAEYALLFTAAVLSLNLSERVEYYVLYALVFIGTLLCLMHRTGRKPEQVWYKCRALAESVKTSTWRFVMRAEPFDGDAAEARTAFRASLRDTLESNQHIGENLAGATSDGAQSTESMESIRAMRWEERRNYYLEHRVGEQSRWYTAKARSNADAAWWYRWISVAIYGLALALVILRIAYPTVKLWPIAPLVVAASGVLGWMQIRKFNELASVYTLTAHEIGIIQGKIRDVDSQVEFSEFVNEAELAFSREHTQWTARQTGRY